MFIHRWLAHLLALLVMSMVATMVTTCSAPGAPVTPPGQGYWLITGHDQAVGVGDARHALYGRDRDHGGWVAAGVAPRTGAGLWLTDSDGPIDALGPAPPLQISIPNAARVAAAGGTASG